MHFSSITALLASAAAVSASPAPIAKDTRQINNRRAGSTAIPPTIIGNIDGGGGPQPLRIFQNPDSVGFGFLPLTIEITLSGASCSLFTGRIGNDAQGNIACDLDTHVKDVFFGDGVKNIRNLGIECAFCSF